MDYKIIKKIFFDLFKIDKIDYPESHVLTVAHDNDRSFFYKGKYYSPLMDTIEDDLYIKTGNKCVSIARIISTIKGDISYGEVYSPEGRFARALLLKRIKQLFSKDYSYSKMEEKIWEDILLATKAKKVLAIMPSRELCTICRKLNIWVADVQHGVIANEHPWYGVGYRGEEPKEYLPNSFLVWDKGSLEVLNWTTKKDSEVSIIGNRWLRRFLINDKQDLLVKESFEKMHQEIKIDSSKKNILVSLSWGCVGIENSIISESLIKIIQQTKEKYNWLLRLHPNQLKGFATHESEIFFKIYKDSLSKCSVWEFPTYNALPVVLSITDVHISWNTSVSIEAAQLGIKTCLLDPGLRNGRIEDYYTYYHHKGLIDYIEDTELSISQWIEENIKNNKNSEDYGVFDENYKNLIEYLHE
ncbi:hypothetical protein [Winogradskyella sp.]|uniref:hypothetical protein n=1 Tax=Winogradskyella sp. TaxID=1883156 RepID=UPI003AB3DBBF